jgi:hypothetical protein
MSVDWLYIRAFWELSIALLYQDVSPTGFLEVYNILILPICQPYGLEEF